MSLNSIRDNYGKLLVAFKDAGVKLSESQKADLDTFIVALESKINETKNNAIRATKKVVEDKLSKEYKAVFESIMKHQAENAELAGKIQDKITQINESKKIASKVDEYLDCYLAEALPEKTIIDYDRMHKLEAMFESVKDALLVNDKTVEDKVESLEKKYANDKKALTEKISSLESQLNESMNREISLKKKVSVAKAEKMVSEKVKDLPLFEARQVQKRLAGATEDEVKANYKQILESVREEMKEACKCEEKSLEEEIKGILEADDTSEKKSDKAAEEVAEAEEKKDDEEKSSEMIDEDDDGIVLNESEKINSDLMKQWIMRACSITPIDNTDEC